MSFQPLFPPYLDHGSSDTGPFGPVRILQGLLFIEMPELARVVGLVADGDYGLATKSLVAFVQYMAMGKVDFPAERVDGNLGPETREYLRREWSVNFDNIPFRAGGECTYVSPEFGKPQSWPSQMCPQAPIVILE
jgi:hypothetical protein